MKSTRKAFVLGYQGFGNVGDEAILAGIEEVLSGSAINVTVIAGGNHAEIAAFPTAGRLTSRRLHPRFSTLGALWKQDVLIFSGGGLLHDHWWNVVPLYLSWVIAARLFGKKVVWIAVGVGPLRRRLTRLLVKLIVSMSSLISVRDEASSKLIYTLTRRRPPVVPDPAFFLPKVVPSTRRGFAAIVREPTPNDTGLRTDLIEALADTLANRRRAGWDITLLTMAGARDAAFAAAVAVAVEVRTSGRPPVEPLSVHPLSALRRLSELELVISMRLHGVILAALAGTPCVPLVYDLKVGAIAEQLNLGDVAVPVEAAGWTQFERSISTVLTTDRQAAVAEKVETLRHQLVTVRVLVESAIR